MQLSIHIVIKDYSWPYSLKWHLVTKKKIDEGEGDNWLARFPLELQVKKKISVIKHMYNNFTITVLTTSSKQDALL